MKTGGNIVTKLSIGEFLDKLTILEIKSDRIKDADRLLNVRNELALLREIWADSGYQLADIQGEYDKLKGINEALWKIEDDIRLKEGDQCFDGEFVQLARSVYVTNDQRAEIKKVINIKLGSDLVEEKSYQDY